MIFTKGKCKTCGVVFGEAGYNISGQIREREIKAIRSDTSTGPDQLPAKYLKLVAEHIAGPLTHIINSFIKILSFPDAWKVARISPIPKVSHPVKNADMRPISILPVLSKVFEKLVHRQAVKFIESRTIFKENISGYRKGHSTTTVRLGIRDDILHAMKRGELTLMILADFSKAFNTIRYKTVLRKLRHLGFSNEYLIWTINYLSGRRHFVQDDDNVSDRCNVNFGVPQGSIMGPLNFNLYVEDMETRINAKCHQYADDTTIYMHCRPENIESTVTALQSNVTKLEHWAKDASLVLNPSKTKLMLMSTPQLSCCHSLDNVRVRVQIWSAPARPNYLVPTFTSTSSGKTMKAIGSSCYATLATLRKLKHVLPFNLRKTIAQSLVLSKLYYNDVIYHALPDYLQKRLQSIQKAAASFVVGRYASQDDVLSLNWLPIQEQRQLNLLTLVHKALYSPFRPRYLRLKVYSPPRNLRFTCGTQVEIPLIANTFQDHAATLFNKLPRNLSREVQRLLLTKAKTTRSC